MRPSEALSLHRSQIREIALRHRVSSVRVFGSALHGDDTGDSDPGNLCTNHRAVCICGLGRSASLQMLAIATAIAVLCA